MTTTLERPDAAPAPEPQPEERPNDWTGLILLLGAIVALGVFASWNWAVIVVALIFMIFMHELGHYLTAKATGMKVTEFFIGFGPRIWSFTRGETEYGVKAIPAGAYVRIIGMNNLDEVEPGDEDRAYRVKSFPRKLLVVTAGSGMHFLMALVLFFGALMINGVDTDDGRWVIGTISDESAAGQTGIEVGDELVSLDGIEIGEFSQFGEAVRSRGGQTVDVVYLSDGETITESVTLGARLTAAGADGFDGLLEGDRILQIDGADVFSWADIESAVGARVGDTIPFVIDPAAGLEPIVVEEVVVLDVLSAEVATTGFFGVSQDRFTEKLGVIGSAGRAVDAFGEFFTAITAGMWDLVTSGAVPAFVSDTVTGDVDSPAENITSDVAQERQAASRALDERNPDEERIVSIYGAARVGRTLTEDGIAVTLGFLATLNISIGILNLLPLPPLDGGHVVIAAYERVRSFGGRRHEVDYNKVLPITYAVFALLMVVGMIAIFRDIVDPLQIG